MEEEEVHSPYLILPYLERLKLGSLKDSVWSLDLSGNCYVCLVLIAVVVCYVCLGRLLGASLAGGKSSREGGEGISGRILEPVLISNNSKNPKLALFQYGD